MKGTRGRPWKTSRRFHDGKFYMYQTIPRKDKPRAKAVAQVCRRRGEKARVTPYKYGYVVWHK